MRVVLVPSLPPRRYAVSAVVHALLIAAWAWSPARTSNLDPLGGAMPVELVGAPPAGGGGAVVPAPPVPTPVEPEPEPPPEPEGPSLQPEPEPEPEKPKPKEPRPRPPKKEEASAPAPGPPGPPGPPSEVPGASTSGTAGPHGGLSLGLGKPGGDFYRASIRAAIEARWRKPVLNSDVPAEVTVAFEILRDGTVRDVEVVTSSGIPALDRSAMRALIEASPLPPFPAGWRESSQPATYSFILRPE